MQNDKCSGYGLVQLLKHKGKIRGVEIGCDVGDTTVYLLQNLPDMELYGVDPYKNYIDWNYNVLNEREHVHIIHKNNTEIFVDRYKLYRQHSDIAALNFEDESLDFIFIDGLHTYEQVKKDCENYYPKVKVGGIFSGHDFNAIRDVNRAVVEFAAKSNQPQIFQTDYDIWYWIK